jgi:uncharacterized protein
MSQLEQFRKAKDRLFATDPQSPLLDEQKKSFKGLKYFPENPALKLHLEMEELPDKKGVQIKTLTGQVQSYTRFGRLKFEVDGEPAELTVYYGENEFFLPFSDLLANTETYGAGRYLEIIPLGKTRFLIDFNYAYNPYCAYNEKWSCPITPAENRLKVPIRAGEKLFHN